MAKKKYAKIKGKRLATNSPEYKEYYDQIMADRAEGIYYNAEAPEITISAKKMTNKEKKELAYWREKFNDPEWTPEKAREQQEFEKQKKTKGTMPVFKKGYKGFKDIPYSPLQQMAKDAYPYLRQIPLGPAFDDNNLPDPFLENVLEAVPYANFYYGADDAKEGFNNMFFENRVFNLCSGFVLCF